jgi:hypothetical protein
MEKGGGGKTSDKFAKNPPADRQHARTDRQTHRHTVKRACRERESRENHVTFASLPPLLPPPPPPPPPPPSLYHVRRRRHGSYSVENKKFLFKREGKRAIKICRRKLFRLLSHSTFSLLSPARRFFFLSSEAPGLIYTFFSPSATSQNQCFSPFLLLLHWLFWTQQPSSSTSFSICCTA